MRRLPLRTFVNLSLVVLCALPASLGPEASPQSKDASSQRVIRTQASEVLVDVVVTDHKNRLVSDLTPDDFTVYEDGVAQHIDSFLVYSTEKPEPATPAEATGAPGEAPHPPSSLRTAAQLANLTIVLLDLSTTEFQNQQLVQQAAAKYVRERMQPNDLMAIFVLGAGFRFLRDFTDDKSKLISALSAKDLWGSALAAERGALSSGISSAESTVLANSQANLTGGISTTGPGAGAIQGGIGGAASGLALAAAAARIEQQYEVMRSYQDERQTRAILTAIRAIAAGVQHIPGRKSLILFSQGFVVGESIEPQLHAVVAAASRAQVAIYAIDASGLTTRALNNTLAPRDELTTAASQEFAPLPAFGSRADSHGGETIFDRTLTAGRGQQESALRYVSDATGGFFIHNTNDLGTGLDRAGAEMHSYYLLSYRPKNQEYDGKFRQIRVEVRPSGLLVRARPGYYAIPSGFEFLTPEEFQVVEAARTTAPGSEFPTFFRAADFEDTASQYRVPVILEVSTKALDFENTPTGGYSARLQIIGLVRDSNGGYVTRFGSPMQLNATEAEWKALEPGTVSFLNHLRLPGGYYSFEVAIKDLASGKVSHSEQALYLRPQEPELGLSSILLAREVDKAVNGSQFLSVGGAKILPLARCEFHNGDNLIFYFDIYHPAVKSENHADVSVKLYLRRDGNPVSVGLPEYHLDEIVSDPVPHITLSRYLQLAGLEPGHYSLVFQVDDALTHKSESAQAVFTVVN